MNITIKSEAWIYVQTGNVSCCVWDEKSDALTACNLTNKTVLQEQTIFLLYLWSYQKGHFWWFILKKSEEEIKCCPDGPTHVL